MGSPGAASGQVHLVGVGGIGMSGIAEVLITLGYRVSGSDLRESEITHRLEELGVSIRYGHDASAMTAEVDVVVISSAVDDGNPEVREARRLRVPVIARAEMLAELMRLKCGVAIAGAHGKTTTTSLVAGVLHEGGFDPTVVIGGRLKALGGSNARLGTSRYMVAEADESDGSFLMLKPVLAVVTNIDREHMNHYGTMERLADAYLMFINSVPFFGRAVLCLDSDEIRGLLPRVKKRYTSYGLAEDADLRAVDIRTEGLASSFEVVHRGVALGRVSLSMPGVHAVLNALAAVAVANEFGMRFVDCARGLGACEGIMRRFEIKGEAGGVTVVDDYAHHPTEIRATLAAARAGFDQRIVAVFQPHRYSRVADLFGDFAAAFDDADEVVLTDVYGAGEEALDGIDSARLAEAVARLHRGKVHYFSSNLDVAGAVAGLTRAGDMLLTMGAGDITRLGPEILARLAS
ncbi:MAG: UDP-N-acetylmuramate--L-alanine ligase [Candidatus Binatia bacterium]